MLKDWLSRLLGGPSVGTPAAPAPPAREIPAALRGSMRACWIPVVEKLDDAP